MLNFSKEQLIEVPRDWSWADACPTEDFSIELFQVTYEMSLFSGRKIEYVETDFIRNANSLPLDKRIAIGIFRGRDFSKKEGSVIINDEEVFFRAIESMRELSRKSKKVYFKFHKVRRKLFFTEMWYQKVDETDWT